MTIWYAISIVFDDVLVERRRQEQLKAEGRFTFTCADAAITDEERMVVLVEEVGEVARQVLTQPGRTGERSNDSAGSRAELRKELVQVAAVAVAWVEGIDAEGS